MAGRWLVRAESWFLRFPYLARIHGATGGPSSNSWSRDVRRRFISRTDKYGFAISRSCSYHAPTLTAKSTAWHHRLRVSVGVGTKYKVLAIAKLDEQCPEIVRSIRASFAPGDSHLYFSARAEGTNPWNIQPLSCSKSRNYCCSCSATPIFSSQTRGTRED